MAWGAPASLGGAAADSGSTGSTATGAAFTAPTAGELLAVCLTVNDTGAGPVTPPSGWTTWRESQDPSGCYVALFLRIADGTEGAALTITWAGGNGHWEIGNVYAISGAPSSLTGIEETAVWHMIDGSNAANPYPALTAAAATTGADELILWCFARTSKATFSSWQAQGGFTELEDLQSGGTSTNSSSHTLAYKILTANETPSAQLNLSNGTREYNGFVLALIPGSGGGSAAVTAALAGTSALSASVSTSGGGAAIAPSLAGTSSLSATVSLSEHVSAALAGTSSLSATVTAGAGHITAALAGTSSFGVTVTAPPLPPTTLSIPLVSQKLEVSWSQDPLGLFVFGHSLFGSSTDKLAGSGWSTTFESTPYDDLSVRVLSVSKTSGRSTDTDDFRASTLTVTLRDPDGLLNRKNPSSPLAGLLLDDRPIRWTVYDADGVGHERFYGFIQDIQADVAGRGTCTITAVDFLDRLGSQNPVIPAIAGATTGQIIGMILDWFRWTDPAMRSLCTGDTIEQLYDHADSSRTGIDLVSELLQSERGICFVDSAGVVTYIDRHTRITETSQGTIDRTMTAFPVGTDAETLVNQEACQLVDMDGNVLGDVQQASDAASITLHGIRDGDPLASPLQTPFLSDDDDVLNLAEYIVMRAKDGLEDVYQVPINIPDLATQQLVLGCDLGDRVTMTVAPLGFAQFTGDFFIEGINESLSPQQSPPYQVSWLVSDAPPVAPFRFGVSLMGGSNPLWY